MNRDMEAFDRENAAALRAIWFCGDVHGQFKYLAQTLLSVQEKPNWIVFLGDLDLDRPLDEILAPLRRHFPDIQVAQIFGNHDGDTYEAWENLHSATDVVQLHGKVTNLGGIKVAGLGGNFMGRVWDPESPSGKSSFRNKDEAMNRGAYQYRDGQRPNPSFHAAIYPDDFARLSKQRADILITHEAPGCHPYGFDALSDLARDMRVVRSFHGHMHDDQSDAYAKVRNDLLFDARAVGFCAIKNGMGEIVFEGPKSWEQ
jgi:hypothetical protein